MELILIRHGQSNANANGILIADKNDTLNSIGVSQVLHLKKLMISMEINPYIVYSSPWKRASQTAELLFDNSMIQYDNRLAETNPGIYGTWLEKDFINQFPEFSDDIESRYEEGESHWDMAQRVKLWVEEEIVKNVENHAKKIIVVVCHGGPISIILQVLLSIPIKKCYPTFTVPNASLTILNWKKDFHRFIVKQVGLLPEHNYLMV